MTFNVTATEQNDTSGFGPSYMLNGLTDKNLWYQTGLEWNWDTNYSTQHAQGFYFFYQVWNTSTDQSIFPSNTGSGSMLFSAPVSPNDTVAMSLTIVGDEVIMAAKDLSSNGTASATYPSYGAHDFTGKYNTGFPTSLMTEWYHILPYFCIERSTVFSNKANPIPSGWLTIDEWNFTGIPPDEWFNATLTGSTLFDLGTGPSPLTSAVGSLAVNGTIIYANSTDFWTM